MWSRVLRRGQTLRLTDVEGGAAVGGALLQRRRAARALQHARHAEGAAHRAPDRGLRSVLRHGSRAVLGRRGQRRLARHHHRPRHAPRTAAPKYGEGSYQELRNDWYRNTRDNFLVELGKYDLGKRDIVRQREFLRQGRGRRRRARSRFVPGNSKPARFVELRAEMNTLVVLSNTPHPLDPRTSYAPKPVALDDARAGARAAERPVPHVAPGERSRFRAHRSLLSRGGT